MIALKEKREDGTEVKNYYQRQSSSNRLLRPEDLCKYVPHRISREIMAQYIEQREKILMKDNEDLKKEN